MAQWLPAVEFAVLPVQVCRLLACGTSHHGGSGEIPTGLRLRLAIVSETPGLGQMWLLCVFPADDRGIYLLTETMD